VDLFCEAEYCGHNLHDVCAEESAYVFAGHIVHDVDPEDENVPIGQATSLVLFMQKNPELQSLHEPSDVLMVPA